MWPDAVIAAKVDAPDTDKVARYAVPVVDRVYSWVEPATTSDASDAKP